MGWKYRTRETTTLDGQKAFEVFKIGREERWRKSPEGALCIVITAETSREAIAIAKTTENACWG